MDACRACGGATTVVFETKILGKYPVDFLRCEVCDSLQPRQPFWIAESYSNAVAATDTGAMVRNLQLQAAVYAVAVCCRARGRFLDFGGGTGVLCRLLRDHGFDAFVTDKYAEPVFARGFSISLDECRSGHFKLVSAIEVLEHLEDPAGEIERLFKLQPDLLVATTVVYKGQGKEWWYLSALTGQHIFFYSKKCLERLARKHGYNYLDAKWIHVFSAKPIGPFRRMALRFSLTDLGLGIFRLWLAVKLRGRAATSDHTALCEQLAAQQAERSDE